MTNKIKTGIPIAATIIALGIALFAGFPQRGAARTGELRVMISDGMKPVIEELTPQIEQATERKLAAEFNSSKNLRDKIQSGEPFDAAIVTTEVLNDLIEKGKVASAGRAEIARTGIGVGVRAGAPKPDISTTEALKRTFLNAKSIGFNPTGASSAPTFDMFARLGIADAIKPKLMLDSEAGQPQRNVAGGKTELVISLVSEIKFFPGVDLVGPVPPDFQSYVNFAAGISTNAQDADGAKALIRFLSGPKIAPVLKSKGMEPH